MDRYGVPTMAQGRGAPLELAVYIGACILTPHRVRVSHGRLVTTVRELRDFLFGPTWRPGPTGNRPGDWERVRAAALNASDLWLPLENGDLWRAVAVRKIPPADYRPEYLDRQVIFDVELPDGAAHGPVIDRLELARLRLVSGPKFRAYIAAHSVAWRPGVTRRRHPRQPERPPVELRPRTLPRSDSGGPAAAGVRVRRQEEPDAGQPGRRMGGPGWGRDPDPDGNHPGWSARLAHRPRGGGGHPRTCATGEWRSRKSLQHNNRTPSPSRPRLRQEEGGEGGAGRRRSLSLSKTGSATERRAIAKERVP